MCPDKQTLSAYFDNELEKPFHELVAVHVGDCGRCKSEVDGIESVSGYLHSGPEPDFEQSKARVREKLENRLPPEPSPNFWNKKIAVPIPMAMAGAVLFFLLVGGIFVVFNRTNGYTSEVSAVAAEESRQAEILMTDLEMVTRYMESHNDIIEVTMQLPEESRFYFSGEPKLIREQDFKNSSQ
jgi:hypothetical protein